VYCALGANGIPGGVGSAVHRQVRRDFVKALSAILSLWLVYLCFGRKRHPRWSG